MDNDDLARTVVEEDVPCPAFSSDPERYPAEAAGYDLQHEVGHGATATVWAARAKACGDLVAVKMFYLDRLKGDKGRAVQEVLTMRSLRHPHVLPVRAHFQEDGHIWLVLPFVNGGSAESILTERHPKGLSEAPIVGIVFPVLQVLSFMHELSLMHRDVKAANVLVCAEGNVYLADYGVVAPVEHVAGSSLTGSPERERVRRRHAAVVSTFTGTPAWMAPEVVAPDEEVGYDERADIWSFGILLLELAHGEAPHEDEPLDHVVTKIVNSEPAQLKPDTEDCTFSQDFRDLVHRCLQKEPADRATAAELLRHPIFKDPIQGGKLVDALFTLDNQKVPKFPSRAKSMAKNGVSAVLQDEVNSALAVLARATAPGKRSGEGDEPKQHKPFHRKRANRPETERITKQDLADCKGLVFGRAHRKGFGAMSMAHGTGFAMARHMSEQGELYWSAPTFLHVVGHGVGLSLGAEELTFVLVLRDYEHLLTAAAKETVVKTNFSQSLVGHRMALQIRLRNGGHTAKLVSFADGKMLAMSVLAINLGADEDMNEKVYGGHDRPCDPTAILDGGMRPPKEFDQLIDELQGLERHSAPMRIASDLSLRSHIMPSTNGEQAE